MRSGQTPGQQRAMSADGHLLLVLYKAPSENEVERRGSVFWRKPSGDEEEAKLSQQAVQTGHRLNVLAAVFFPLTAIASLFGMNMHSGLEDFTWDFRVVLLAGISVGVVVREWVLGNLAQRLDFGDLVD